MFFDYFTQYAKVRRRAIAAISSISLITSFAATIFGLAFVIVLFQKAPQLAGLDFPEELFLYGFSLIPYGMFNIISANLYDFGNNYIIEGKFDRDPAAPDFFAVSNPVRDVSHRVGAGNRARDFSACGGRRAGCTWRGHP